MADKKIISFEFHDDDDGSQPGTNLVPTNQNKDLVSQQREQAEQFGDIITDDLRRFEDWFQEELDAFFDWLHEQRREEDDIIEGEFSVGNGGSGNIPPDEPSNGSDSEDPDYDPFKSVFGRFTRDTQEWLDDLAAEYQDHMRVLEAASAEYDDLTAQADALGASVEEVAEADIALAGTLGEVGLALGVIITAAFAFNRAVNELVEAVGGFSAQVVEASTRSRIQEIEDRIRLAEEAGGDIASLENIRNELAHELRSIFRESIELLSPAFEVIGKILTEIIKEIRIVVETLSSIFHIIEKSIEAITGMLANILGDLPFGIGTFFRKLDAWMRKDDQIDNQKSLNQMVDDLFDPKNF